MAVACDDQIRLSWDKVLNADHYRITVDFQTVDMNGQVTDETFNVFLGKTSDTYYIDAYPFEGMNHYKVMALNEYGIGDCSEVSCYNPNTPEPWNGPGVSETINGVVLYPNPVDNLLNIAASNINRVTLEDSAGHVWMDSDSDGSAMTINVSQYEEGIYRAHVFTDNGEVVKRFVVARPL